MMNGDQGRDYSGPWFPPLTAEPVPPPPIPEGPVETLEVRPPAWLQEPPRQQTVVIGVPQRNRLRWMMPGAATILVIAGLFGSGAVALTSTDSAKPTLAEPALGSFENLTPPDWCPEVETAGRIMGSGKGDLDTGPGVILWLEHAYYVERDPAAVRSTFAPGAAVASAEATRKAIEAVVPGTKYCVEIVVQAPQRFHVRVDELRPDGKAVTWGQVMIITDVEGRPMISAIRPVDDEG